MSTRELYDDSAHDYDERFADLQLYEGAARAFLAERAPARLLDLGCGTGRLTRELPPEVEVVGLDISPQMIEVARRTRASGRYEVYDFHDPLPEDLGSFDAAIAMGCLNSCRDLAGVLGRLAGVLRPGGRLFVNVDERRQGLRLQEEHVFEISPRHLPGVCLYFWSFEETSLAALAAGLLPLRYSFQPGWLLRSHGAEIQSGFWEFERR